MRLTLEKGHLAIPNDLSFEIQINHPFLSDEGVSSIPVTIPATSENLAILDYPTRLGNSLLKFRSYSAALAHGVYHMTGKLIVSSAGERDGIHCSFASKESIIYAELQDTSLKDIFSRIPSLVFGTKSTGGNIDDALWYIYKNNLDLSFYMAEGAGIVCFPVKVDDDGYGFSILNDPNESDTGFVCEKRSITNEEGNTMVYPYLFGLTPFIMLWRMLDLCFEISGYQVSENCFKEDPLSFITVLNNCADVCVNNSVVFRDLVPDMTIGELIVWLQDKFGAMVCFDGNSVAIKLMETTLAMTPDMDLTQHVENGETISFPPSNRIILDCSKSLEGAEPPKDMTISEYLKQYDTFWKISGYPVANSDSLYDGEMHMKPIISSREGTVIAGEFEDMGTMLGNLQGTLLGSTAFRYDRGESEDTDERTAVDQYVPVYIDATRRMIFPYIGEPQYMHTKVDSNEEVAYSQELSICWKLLDPDTGLVFGSSQAYSFNARLLSVSFPLTPDGIYHIFWKSYNQLLMASAPEIKVRMNLPISEITRIDLTVPKLFRGQKVLIKNFTIEVSEGGVRSGECILQAIPSFAKTINDQDIYATDSLTWKHVGIPVIRTNNGEVTATDGLQDYNELPSINPSTLGERYGQRTRYGTIKYHDGSAVGNFHWKEYFLAVLKE